MRGALAISALLSVAACHATALDAPARLDQGLRAAARPFPTDPSEFLAEVSPLPSPTLLVVYDVRGAGGLTGTLEVMLAAGGKRRENWKLTVATGDDSITLEGSTIQTPDAIMTEGPRGRSVGAVGLGALARAWLAADPATQHAAVDALRHLHARVALAEAAPTDVVLGVPCRRVQMASSQLCMWDATGLPLTLRAEQFELQAVSIDLAPELGPSAFRVEAEAPASEFDGAAALEALARGEVSPIAAWLHPGLRLPDPAA